VIANSNHALAMFKAAARRTPTVPGRRSLTPSGARLRGRLTTLAARRSSGPYFHTVPSGAAPRAPPRERWEAVA
jgi:hypothetical protein